MQKYIWKSDGMWEDQHGHFYATADVDARIAELSAALKAYCGRGHKEDCDYTLNLMPCSCGFESLRQFL